MHDWKKITCYVTLKQHFYTDIQICAKMVPRLLNERTKAVACASVSRHLSYSKLNRTCWKEWLLAMSHGSWDTIYLPNGIALNWIAHLSPWPKKARVFKSKTKVMMIAFVHVHGIAHTELFSQGQTISSCTKNLAASDALSEGEVKRTVENEVMAASSWQCSSSLCLGNLGVSCQKKQPNIKAHMNDQPCWTGEITLLSRSGPMWLLLGSQAQGSLIKGTRF